MESNYFKHESLSNMVVNFLKNKILTGEYTEGHRILESSLAEELGISRAPVREGIKELENQGLIQSIPRKGNFVVKMDIEDVKEIFDIRIMLESYVLDILIKDEKLTDEDFIKLTDIVDEMVRIAKEEGSIIRVNEKDMAFHNYLWAKSGSKRSVKILSDLYFQLQMAMVIDTELTGNLDETARDHYEIIEYLKRKDIERCQAALKNHILTLRSR